MDVKYLMRKSDGKDPNKIDELAQFIEEKCSNCRKPSKDEYEDQKIMKEALEGSEV